MRSSLFVFSSTTTSIALCFTFYLATRVLHGDVLRQLSHDEIIEALDQRDSAKASHALSTYSESMAPFGLVHIVPRESALGWLPPSLTGLFREAAHALLQKDVKASIRALLALEARGGFSQRKGESEDQSLISIFEKIRTTLKEATFDAAYASWELREVQKQMERQRKDLILIREGLAELLGLKESIKESTEHLGNIATFDPKSLYQSGILRGLPTLPSIPDGVTSLFILIESADRFGTSFQGIPLDEVETKILDLRTTSDALIAEILTRERRRESATQKISLSKEATRQAFEEGQTVLQKVLTTHLLPPSTLPGTVVANFLRVLRKSQIHEFDIKELIL
jgi:hypothetical protein